MRHVARCSMRHMSDQGGVRPCTRVCVWSPKCHNELQQATAVHCSSQYIYARRTTAPPSPIGTRGAPLAACATCTEDFSVVSFLTAHPACYLQNIHVQQADVAHCGRGCVNILIYGRTPTALPEFKCTICAYCCTAATGGAAVRCASPDRQRLQRQKQHRPRRWVKLVRHRSLLSRDR